MDTASPLKRAIALAGSETRLGQATGFSQAAINKAKRRGRASAEMALAIHRFTGGEVSASELRPDLWSRAVGPRSLAGGHAAMTPSPIPESAPLPADRRSPPKSRPPLPPAATVTNAKPRGDPHA